MGVGVGLTVQLALGIGVTIGVGEMLAVATFEEGVVLAAQASASAATSGKSNEMRFMRVTLPLRTDAHRQPSCGSGVGMGRCARRVRTHRGARG